MMLLLALLVPWAARAEVVEIGNPSATTTQYTVPVNMFYHYSLTQQIFPACEIGTAGTINSIAFEYTNNSATTCAIYGLEVADTTAAATALDSRPETVYGDKTYRYVRAVVAPTAIADVAAMLNNYDQFVYQKSGTTLVANTGYNPTRNRHISALDGRYPYACNNLQVNVAGMATTEGGILRMGDGIYAEIEDQVAQIAIVGDVVN